MVAQHGAWLTRRRSEGKTESQRILTMRPHLFAMSSSVSKGWGLAMLSYFGLSSGKDSRRLRRSGGA